MEIATCKHAELIGSGVNGIEEGTCKICGQVRRYNTIDRREGIKVIKLGRINGTIVLPFSKDILDLSAQEADELAAAIKEGKLVRVAEKAGVAPEQSAQSGREWYQAHKKEMIEDLITMDYTAFLEKWKIKRQIVSHLKSDKLYKRRVPGAETAMKRCRKPKHSKGVSVPPPLPKVKILSGKQVGDALEGGEVNRMPRFPAWDAEKWTEGIAVQWLRTYEALFRLQQPAAPEIKEAQRVLTKKKSWLTRLLRQ